MRLILELVDSVEGFAVESKEPETTHVDTLYMSTSKSLAEVFFRGACKRISNNHFSLIMMDNDCAIFESRAPIYWNRVEESK